MAGDLETRIEGEPGSITAVATWLRTGLKPGLDDLGDTVARQRTAASGDWQGEAGSAFASRSQTLVTVADDAAATSASVADAVDDLATALRLAQRDMADVREDARAGGLTVLGTLVLNPGDGPPSAGPSPAADAPPAQWDAWQRADQAVRVHNARVEVWNACVRAANAAYDRWLSALEAAASNWNRNSAKLVGLGGQLLGAAVQLELIRRTTPILVADVDSMLTRAARLREHADALVGPDGRVLPGNRRLFFELLDEARDLENAHPGARGRLPSWELPKGLTRGLWAIDVATAGYGIYSDMQDGEGAAQAVTSNVLPAGAAILAGTASGAYMGGVIGSFVPIPGVGTAAGVVVGAAVGTVVGAFTSGAIDSLWQSGADSLGDWGEAVADGFDEIGETFESAGDLAGDVFDSIF